MADTKANVSDSAYLSDPLQQAHLEDKAKTRIITSGSVVDDDNMKKNGDATGAMIGNFPMNVDSGAEEEEEEEVDSGEAPVVTPIIANVAPLPPGDSVSKIDAVGSELIENAGSRESIPVKRKKGRPRKNQPVIEPNVPESALNQDVMAPIQEEYAHVDGLSAENLDLATIKTPRQKGKPKKKTPPQVQEVCQNLDEANTSAIRQEVVATAEPLVNFEGLPTMTSDESLSSSLHGEAQTASLLEGTSNEIPLDLLNDLLVEGFGPRRSSRRSRSTPISATPSPLAPSAAAVAVHTKAPKRKLTGSRRGRGGASKRGRKSSVSKIAYESLDDFEEELVSETTARFEEETVAEDPTMVGEETVGEATLMVVETVAEGQTIVGEKMVGEVASMVVETIDEVSVQVEEKVVDEATSMVVETVEPAAEDPVICGEKDVDEATAIVFEKTADCELAAMVEEELVAETASMIVEEVVGEATAVVGEDAADNLEISES